MRVLLLNPPGERLYLRDNYCSLTSKARYCWAPIDLVVLSGLLGAAGFDVRVLDANNTGMKPGAAREHVRRLAPDVVIAVTGTASWPEDRAFLRSLKEGMRPRIFLSGGFLLTEGERVLAEEGWADGVLRSYVFSGIERFLRDPGDGPFDMVHRDESGAIVTARAPGKRNYTLPYGRHHDFPRHVYQTPMAVHSPLASMTWSIGCPLRCSFCISSIIDVYQRDVDDTVGELLHVRAGGAREILWTDQTFSANQRLTRELCQGIRDRRLDLSWACQTHVSCVSEPTLAAMKAAGCHTIFYGVETATPDLMKRYLKQSTPETVRRALRLTREAGIRSLAYFIVGLPGETAETTRRSIEFALELNPDYLSLSFATPDAGTALGVEASRNGWYEGGARPIDSSSDASIATPALSRDDARRLMREFLARFYLRPSYVLRSARNIRSATQLTNLITNGLHLATQSLRR